MAEWWRGLLDDADAGVRRFDGLLGGGDTVPEGATYSVADQRMARMAMLGSAGATLLAAAQAGPIGARGQHLAQLAQVPVQGAQMLQQAGQQRMQQQLTQAQVAALRAKATGSADLARVLSGGGGEGGVMPAGGGAPAAPGDAIPPQGTPQGPAPTPAGGGFYSRIRSVESSGNPTAANPRSTSRGLDGFTGPTWMSFARANPQLFPNMNEQQILARRSDAGLNDLATRWNTQQNAQQLGGAGLPVHDGSLALAHRFGAGGASSVLRADPSAQIGPVVGPDVMRANPDLGGLTVGQVRNGVLARFGTGSTWQQAPGAQASTQPLAGAAPPGGAQPASRAGYNGNTLANMPPELRALAAARARAGDSDGATEIVTKWLTTQPPAVQTVTVGGQVREVTRTGELGRNYGQAGNPQTINVGGRVREQLPDGSLGRDLGPQGAQRRPMTPEERAAWPQLDSRRAYSMGEDGVPHAIEGAGTNITIANDDAGRQAGIRRVEKARELSDPVVSTAVPQAVMMREQLLSGLTTGRFDDATLSARQVLQSLNLLTPEQAQKADQQTLFRAMSSSMIPRMRAAGSGSSSDLDVRMFSQAAPILATSPQGNLTIASSFIQTAEHEQARINAMEGWLAEKGSLVGFDAHWRREGPPLFPRVSTLAEAMTGHPPGTVVILPDAAKAAGVPTFPFYVVPNPQQQAATP